MNRARNRVGFEYHYDAKIQVKILFFCDAFTFNALAGSALMGVKSPEWVDRSFFCGAVGRPWKPTTAPKKTGPTTRTCSGQQEKPQKKTVRRERFFMSD